MRKIGKKNKRGQQIMIGIMIMVMAVIIFIATLPAIKSLMDNLRQSDSLNCNGYVHPTNPSLSYNSTLQEDTLSCTIIDIGLPYLILGVLIGVVSLLLRNRLVEPEQPTGYPGY